MLSARRLLMRRCGSRRHPSRRQGQQRCYDLVNAFDVPPALRFEILKEKLMLSSFRTGCALALAAVLATGLAQAQTVDQVVAKNLQGRGGVKS